MKLTTKQRLINLTNLFYQKHTQTFSHTRTTPWSFWDQYLSKLSYADQYRVVDLGCGNGRFATFLTKQSSLTIQEYVGYDNNHGLLNLARQTIIAPNYHFYYQNVFSLSNLTFNSPNLITLFGLFHHLPRHIDRKYYLGYLFKQLIHPGKIIISLWQFMHNPKYAHKVLPQKQLTKYKLDPNELEFNDYLLGWQNSYDQVRYCHHFSTREIPTYIPSKHCKAEFIQGTENDRLNTYLILNTVN